MLQPRCLTSVILCHRNPLFPGTWRPNTEMSEAISDGRLIWLYGDFPAYDCDSNTVQLTYSNAELVFW